MATCREAIQKAQQVRCGAGTREPADFAAVAAYWFIADAILTCGEKMRDRNLQNDALLNAANEALEREGGDTIRLKSLDALEQAVESYCNTEIGAIRGACEGSFQDVRNYCFDATYALTMLKDRYGIGAGHSRVRFARKYGPTEDGRSFDTSWALGVVVGRVR